MRKRFETRTDPLLTKRNFLFRLMRHALISCAFVLMSLVIGIIGYRYFEGMSLVDAYLNASMILGGMGPVGELHTENGKLFAGTYALYSGLVAIIATGVLAAPILHRFLHRFHLETE